MPTEDEPFSINLSAFASCPPEDARDAQTQSQHTHSLPQVVTTVVELSAPLIPTAHPLQQSVVHTVVLPRSDADAQPGASQEPRSKCDGCATDDTASPTSPPAAGSPDDNDARLAWSLGRTKLRESEGTTWPAYLSYSFKPPLPHSTSSFLHPGSKFKGTQQSDRQVYEVQVEIKNVDLAESTLCGYLKIQGLTEDHPTLTTFFEGEIVGPKYFFKTEHPSWNSSEKIDLQHWARFPAWRPFAKPSKTSSSFTLKNNLQREHLFMRWKEYFLVPDHRVKSISGASFEGFYYICFDQRAGDVSGIYFHAKSEKYQQLELRHVRDGGCQPAIEFR